MSWSTLARTLMSSIETGSSAMTSSGPRMIARARTARCFWPPERSLGYLRRKRSTGTSPTRSSASRRRASSPGARRGRCRGSERVADGVADGHRRVERGVRVLEDELHPLAQRPEVPFGQVRRSSGRRARSSRRSTWTRDSTARQSVVLPLPDSPTSPSTSPRCSWKLTPSTAFTDPVSRPSTRWRKSAAQPEVDLHAADVEKHRGCREVRLRRQRRSPLARAAPGRRVSGGRPVRAASTRRGGPAAPPCRSARRRHRPASPRGSAGGSGIPKAVRRGRAAPRG